MVGWSNWGHFRMNPFRHHRVRFRFDTPFFSPTDTHSLGTVLYCILSFWYALIYLNTESLVFQKQYWYGNILAIELESPLLYTYRIFHISRDSIKYLARHHLVVEDVNKEQHWDGWSGLEFTAYLLKCMPWNGWLNQHHSIATPHGYTYSTADAGTSNF